MHAGALHAYHPCSNCHSQLLLHCMHAIACRYALLLRTCLHVPAAAGHGPRGDHALLIMTLGCYQSGPDGHVVRCIYLQMLANTCEHGPTPAAAGHGPKCASSLPSTDGSALRHTPAQAAADEGGGGGRESMGTHMHTCMQGGRSACVHECRIALNQCAKL